MKIVSIGSPQVIMSNPCSKHNYFGWPSAIRLQNGRIAVAASGFRLRHICPFGKAVLSVSEDEGQSYSSPAVVIDTVLDDRDAGLTAFGEKGLIVTSFNNQVEFQKSYNERRVKSDYCLKYLESISSEEEARDLGSTFRISHDCGVTYGPIHHSPITSPHGPVELADGTVLWVGRTFMTGEEYACSVPEDCIAAYAVDTEDGSMTYLGRIDAVFRGEEDLVSCEPFAMQLPDGSVLCHIRVQTKTGEDEIFTTYQSKSFDGGRTWTRPCQILGQKSGAPAHVLLHSSGLLISVYGYREEPYGIRCAISADQGESWSTDYWIYQNHVSPDLGYPATVELRDGSLLTVFYAHPKEGEPAVIMQQKWRLESE